MDIIEFLVPYYGVIVTGSLLRQHGWADWWPEWLDIIEHTRILLGRTTIGDSK